jgi:hypothetical protein
MNRILMPLEPRMIIDEDLKIYKIPHKLWARYAASYKTLRAIEAEIDPIIDNIKRTRGMQDSMTAWAKPG